MTSPKSTTTALPASTAFPTDKANSSASSVVEETYDNELLAALARIKAKLKDKPQK